MLTAVDNTTQTGTLERRSPEVKRKTDQCIELMLTQGHFNQPINSLFRNHDILHQERLSSQTIDFR